MNPASGDVEAVLIERLDFVIFVCAHAELESNTNGIATFGIALGESEI